MPNVVSTMDLVSRPDNMNETVLSPWSMHSLTDRCGLVKQVHLLDDELFVCIFRIMCMHRR